MPHMTRPQLLRLLDEAHAVLTEDQIGEMAVSMDLNHAAVATRLDVATEQFEAIKDTLAFDQRTKRISIALATAARDIEEAAKELNREEKPCEHCSAVRWTNRDEHQKAVELDAVVYKLRRFAKELTTPKDAKPEPEL